MHLCRMGNFKRSVSKFRLLNSLTFFVFLNKEKEKSNPYFYVVQTGIFFRPAAIGIPKNPMNTVMNHCAKVRGAVLANFPRNSTIMIWNRTVELRTPTKT